MRYNKYAQNEIKTPVGSKNTIFQWCFLLSLPYSNNFFQGSLYLKKPKRRYINYSKILYMGSYSKTSDLASAQKQKILSN